jgi:hypothetical protein
MIASIAEGQHDRSISVTAAGPDRRSVGYADCDTAPHRTDYLPTTACGRGRSATSKKSIEDRSRIRGSRASVRRLVLPGGIPGAKESTHAHEGAGRKPDASALPTAHADGRLSAK